MATSKTSPETWKQRYDIASNAQETMFQKFQGWYDLMYAHVNTDNYALWRSKVFIPLIPAKAKSMIAKLQSLKPGWEIGLYGDALNDAQSQDKAEKAQWKLEHDWDNPNFDEPMSDKLFSPLMDAVITGTGVAKIPWCFGDTVRYEKYKDPSTGQVDITKDEKITSSRGYNDLIPHDVMSTFVAPGSKSAQSAAWIILEDWVTFNQLERENEAAGGNLYDKNGMKIAETMKSTADRFYRNKSSRDLTLSSQDPITADTTIDQFKRLECYEKDSGMIYTLIVGDSGEGEEKYVELASRKNIYWHGRYPLAFFYVTKRPHSIWGQGVFEDTERLQSAFNDLFNHYMDNLNLSLDGMIMKQQGEEYNYVVEPGGEFVYRNNPPQQFKFPDPSPAQFNTVLNFIESQVENSTVSSYALGAPNSATDNTHGTATGIMRLQEAAGDKLSAMKSQFANSLRDIGRQWLSNNQQFVDRPLTLMGQVDSKPAPVTIDPADLQGEMVLRINDASMEPSTKEEQINQFNAYFQQLVQIQQASITQAQMTKWTTEPIYFDFISLAQDISQRYGQANFDKIMLDQDKVEEAMQASRSPMLMPNERFTVDINELYGSEASQFLERNGIQPDEQRQTQVPAARTTGIDAPADPNQAAADQAKLTLEQQKLGLQADQQQHNQEKDVADFILKAHHQHHQVNQDVINGQTQSSSTARPVGSGESVR